MLSGASCWTDDERLLRRSAPNQEYERDPLVFGAKSSESERAVLRLPPNLTILQGEPLNQPVCNRRQRGLLPRWILFRSLDYRILSFLYSIVQRVERFSLL